MFLLPIILILLTGQIHSTYVWPNYLYDELEHLLVDQEGFNSGAYFKRAITPCTHYVNGNQTLGRMTAAQWLRTAFHDFATADVAAGTGGMDASIGWETDRPENVGSAFNDSLSFFAPFVNQYVSMADMIALSVVTSVGVCSFPNIHIPFRGGRVDASEAGAFGVPEPETDIQTTLNQFAQAGFNQPDTIGLTACGHTLGNVHHAGFPQVVGPEAVTPDNTGGGIHFDSTVDVFDVLVVNEYLEGTGQRGGPLVTSDNVTVRSDFRLYTSDNNLTMKGLSNSQEYFVSECISLMARMLNTVPSSTTLSAVIVPVDVKPVNITLDFMEDEYGPHIVFAGYIRLLSTAFTENATVKLSWLDRNGGFSPTFSTAAKYNPSVQKSGGMFGDTFYHAFNTTINPTIGISSFEVIVEDSIDQGRSSRMTIFTNGGNGYPVQDRVFVMNSRSILDEEGRATLTAAVLSAGMTISSVTATFSFPIPQIGTMSPSINSLSLPLTSLNSSTISNLGYKLFNASIQLPLGNSNAYQVTVDVTAALGDEEVIDKFRRLRL
ncbi:heme peroxidase [Lentinula boryana]|uniref:Peroxidase n=1 Tax=Lentinula boryana TaxID=40481 RepID=A0ABQ8QKW3_9AGAR|nr:heme peroxidase [Lentinula boryana]